MGVCGGVFSNLACPKRKEKISLSLLFFPVKMALDTKDISHSPEQYSTSLVHAMKQWLIVSLDSQKTDKTDLLTFELSMSVHSSISGLPFVYDTGG